MIARERSLLVIGGSGFFGKSMLDAFRRGLLAPWGITRIMAAARQPEVLQEQHAELTGPGVELVALDITTATRLPDADIIIHAANTSDARRYAADPQGEGAAILASVENFVRLAARGRRETRIVYTSSGAVYGAQPATLERIDEDHRPGDADELIDYKRDYAKAKLQAERAIFHLGSSHGISVAVARCFAFVGPYLPRDQHFAVGNFLADAIAGRTIRVRAAHPVIRSYLHADDLAEWLLAIADDASPSCPVYNVGSDEAVEIKDLAKQIGDLFGVRVDCPIAVPTPIDRYVPSIARAADRLGVMVRHNLLAALTGTVRQIAPDRLVGKHEPATGFQHSAAAVN